MTLNVGVLAPGKGTNLEAIIRSCLNDEISAQGSPTQGSPTQGSPTQVKIVISYDPSSASLERAKRFGIPTAVHIPSSYSTRQTYEKAVIEELKKYNVELVCLDGYMKIVGPDLLGAFPQRIINIHPALLPSFPGIDAQRQALEYGVKITGCTVHFIDEKLDHGPIIIQRAVPVMENDTVESLSQRILEEEHKLYPEAIGLFAQGSPTRGSPTRGRLKIEGRRVMVE